MQLIKKESAAPNVPAPEGNPLSLNTDSTIKISVLLGIVNKYFPDILPENVYKHFYETCPDGESGKKQSIL